MIDKIQDIASHLEQLPADTQEEALAYITALIDALTRDVIVHKHLQQRWPTMPQAEPWHDPVGAWSDLPDSILQELDQLRHATPPTPPIEQL